MANEGEYKIRIGADSTQADGTVDAFAAKEARLKTELEQATAAAQRWNVSLEEAQAALAQMRTEDFQGRVMALKNAMREADAATSVSVESAAQQTARMQSLLNDHQQLLMRNVFYVHRLAEGFKDISMGGRMAGQGLMDVSESLQYMVAPEMAIYIVIAQVVGMLAVMATSHRHAGEAAKSHAEDEKTVKEAIEKTTEAIIGLADAASKTHLEVLTQQLKDYLGVQKQLIDQQTTWDTNADKRLGYLQKETVATQNLALAQLEKQKQLDLNAATSDQQREQISADYKRKEIGMKGGNAQEANLAEQTLLAQQKQEDDAERATRLADNRDLDKKLTALKEDAAMKATRAVADGFQPDEAGSFESQIKPQEEKAKQAAQGLAEAQAKADELAKKAAELQGAALAANAISPMLGIPAQALADHAGELAKLAGASTISAQTNSTGEQTKLADLRDAEAARKALNKDGKDLEDAIKKNSDSIDKLVTRLDEIYSKQRELSTEAKTEAVGTDISQLAAASEADKAQAELHWKTWQDTIRQNQKTRAEGKKTETEAFDKDELEPAQAKLESDREALEAYQQSVREIAAHSLAMGAHATKHAEQTAAAAQAVKQQLDRLQEAVARDEQAVRNLQQQHKATQTNALQ